jgi:hypothetical protein
VWARLTLKHRLASADLVSGKDTSGRMLLEPSPGATEVVTMVYHTFRHRLCRQASIPCGQNPSDIGIASHGASNMDPPYDSEGDLVLLVCTAWLPKVTSVLCAPQPGCMTCDIGHKPCVHLNSTERMIYSWSRL